MCGALPRISTTIRQAKPPGCEPMHAPMASPPSERGTRTISRMPTDDTASAAYATVTEWGRWQLPPGPPQRTTCLRNRSARSIPCLRGTVSRARNRSPWCPCSSFSSPSMLPLSPARRANDSARDDSYRNPERNVHHFRMLTAILLLQQYRVLPIELLFDFRIPNLQKRLSRYDVRICNEYLSHHKQSAVSDGHPRNNSSR